MKDYYKYIPQDQLTDQQKQQLLAELAAKGRAADAGYKRNRTEEGIDAQIEEIIKQTSLQELLRPLIEARAEGRDGYVRLGLPWRSRITGDRKRIYSHCFSWRSWLRAWIGRDPLSITNRVAPFAFIAATVILVHRMAAPVEQSKKATWFLETMGLFMGVAMTPPIVGGILSCFHKRSDWTYDKRVATSTADLCQPTLKALLTQLEDTGMKPVMSMYNGLAPKDAVELSVYGVWTEEFSRYLQSLPKDTSF